MAFVIVTDMFLKTTGWMAMEFVNLSSGWIYLLFIFHFYFIQCYFPSLNLWQKNKQIYEQNYHHLFVFSFILCPK